MQMPKESTFNGFVQKNYYLMNVPLLQSRVHVLKKTCTDNEPSVNEVMRIYSQLTKGQVVNNYWCSWLHKVMVIILMYSLFN